MEEYADRPDVLLVCVKYYDIEAAIELARRTAGEDTIVLPILNVYGTGGVMQAALPDSLTVLDGCMYVFGMIKEPGVISQPQSILRVFYGFRKGQDRHLEAKARELEQVFKAGGGSGACRRAATTRAASFWRKVSGDWHCGPVGCTVLGCPG